MQLMMQIEWIRRDSGLAVAHTQAKDRPNTCVVTWRREKLKLGVQRFDEKDRHRIYIGKYIITPANARSNRCRLASLISFNNYKLQSYSTVESKSGKLGKLCFDLLSKLSRYVYLTKLFMHSER